jgi:hypothetical protein
VIREAYPWLPAAGLEFVIRIDGFAWMFAMLVTGIGALVALYARYYMSPDDPVPRFFSLFLAFMGAMLGVVVSGNLVQLAVFWELTSLVSFLLIGYWYHRADARRGARMSLGGDRGGGALPARRRAADRAHRRQPRPRRGARRGKRLARPSALSRRARPRAARAPDQERAVPVPLLAAARDGGADAGVRRTCTRRRW